MVWVVLLEKIDDLGWLMWMIWLGLITKDLSRYIWDIANLYIITTGIETIEIVFDCSWRSKEGKHELRERGDGNKQKKECDS